MTSRNNWRHGHKVVWTDDDGEQFLGKIVGETWERITVDFSEHPYYGLLDGGSATKVVRASEIRLQENESNFLLETTDSGLLVSLSIEAICERNGCPLDERQKVLAHNAIKHSLFNQLMKKHGK